MRPVGIVVFVGVVVAQLTTARAGPLVWCLSGAVALLALGSLLPLSSVPDRLRFAGFLVWTVLAAVLFSEDAGTAAGGFVFLAAAGAGQLLDLRWERAVVAVIASVTTPLGVLAVHGAHHGGWPWWTGAFAGVAVTVGLARRAGSDHCAAVVEIRRLQALSAAADSRWRSVLERTTEARRTTDTVSESLSSVAIQLEVVDALRQAAPDESRVEPDSRSLSALHSARSMTLQGVAASRRVAEELDAVRALGPSDGTDVP